MGWESLVELSPVGGGRAGRRILSPEPLVALHQLPLCLSRHPPGLACTRVYCASGSAPGTSMTGAEREITSLPCFSQKLTVFNSVLATLPEILLSLQGRLLTSI